MLRFLRHLFVVLGFAAFTAAVMMLCSSPDPLYTTHEWLAFGRFSDYDELVREQCEKRGLDPLLIKAIVWRESAFDANKVGTKGERGLMQVREAAAQDWAKAGRIETFLPTDLFDARTNLDVGTWYFRRALDRWKAKEDPIPFALAEYNAGASRVDRWIAQSGLGERADAHDLLNAIDFPGTRRYVDDIVERYRSYRARGGL
jgi:soluble lytic murein transglycosylase